MSSCWNVSQAADQVTLACPVCGSRLNRVTDSRSHKGVKFRQRTCATCSEKFTTAEQTIDTSIYDVIVKNQTFKVVDDRET
jgi:transcriptional regulator NrdR family protein